MGVLFEFEHFRADGLNWHVMHASDMDIVEPLWSGLWELGYGDDPRLNPFLRFGINNGEGEWLAVWRALAWVMTAGTNRVGLPAYYRDDAARNLGVDRTKATLIPWEYEVDLEKSTFTEANIRFIRARSAVHINPPPTEWEYDHRRLAGLVDLATFGDLTQLELAGGFDATSEISLFGVAGGDSQSLGSRLNTVQTPMLSEVLDDRDVFADLSVTRDRFPDTHSYFAFASHQDLTAPLLEKSNRFEAQWATYRRDYSSFTTLEDFADGVERLLCMPTA
ncbi:hypothetical protein K8W59_17825 [Nocardioides rotundus]|uniref:hypothetical protein n=1 Tax=Nocardioides rotundus TaxID=1774216 RepID=UPI001CBB5DFB|nr:hypothetical protein [Nocardioides rotundus]UAL29580.1 hypothetical protein K8W59_17825 [Nocardioides rotundus]